MCVEVFVVVLWGSIARGDHSDGGECGAGDEGAGAGAAEDGVGALPLEAVAGISVAELPEVLQGREGEAAAFDGVGFAELDGAHFGAGVVPVEYLGAGYVVVLIGGVTEDVDELCKEICREKNAALCGVIILAAILEGLANERVVAVCGGAAGGLL